MAFLLFLVIIVFGMCKSDGIDNRGRLFGKTQHKVISSPNIVQFKSAKYGHCSGALISPREVLTSAKCIKGMKLVQLHIHSFEGPHAKRHSKSFTIIDELGLIKLKLAVPTNFSARFQVVNLKSQSNATVALWEFVNDKLTATMRQVVLMKKNEHYFYIHPGVPCKPNVGGPLYLDGSLIGIMSPGDECGKNFVSIAEMLDDLDSNAEYSNIDHVASKNMTYFIKFAIIGITVVIAYFCYTFYYVVFRQTNY